MKRLSIFIILLLFPVLVLAKNKMSMVTYFPVPYVAYSQVNADKQLDIGLTSTCDMNLGCNESNINLKANQVNLTGGKLELNGGKGISGQTMTVGTGSGAGTISFTNIRIQGGNMESLNAGSMNVKELHLFGKKFPSCKDANGSGQMQWEALTLQGATKQELYLTCGDLGAASEPEADCSDSSYKLAHKSECCVSSPKTDTDCWTPKAGVLKLSNVEVLPKEANCDRIDSDENPFGPSRRTSCDGRSDPWTNNWLAHKTLGVEYSGDETSVSRCSSEEVTCFKILDCAKGYRENRLIGHFICETGYEKNGW